MGEDGKRHAAGQHLLTSTRGRILVLLCSGRRTVADIASDIDLTHNAVRAQLQRLQRDGLARPTGSRRGVRRPHAEYELTAQAREMFPRAYEPVLQRLVDVISERLSEKLARDLLVRAGRRLLTEHLGKLTGRSVRQRLEQIMSKLNGSSLGIGLARERGKTIVRSCACPVASVTAAHPELCDVFARLFGEILNADVRQTCEKDESPRCRFEVTPGDTKHRA
jgi:predicted ArsR family transcriptional regulator